MLPPAIAPAPVDSSLHLNPRIPLEAIVIEPDAAVNPPDVLFFVPRKIESESSDQPPILPLTTFNVRASMFPAVIRDAFRAFTSILSALIVPAVICVALMRMALTVLADREPVKIPLASI